MRKPVMPLVAAAVLITSFAAIPAQAETPESATPASIQQEQGKVVAMDPSQIVLGTDEGLKRFAITAETQQPLDFAPGDYVNLYYKLGPGGGSIATIAGIEDMEKPSSPVTPAQPSETVATTGSTSAVPESSGAVEIDESEPVEVARATSTPESRSTSEVAGAPTELPQTASDVPLIGLIGLVALAGAVALRLFVRA